MKHKIIAGVLLAAAFSVHTALADDAAPFRTKVRSLAAFKNGLGFVYRTGTANLTDGWVVTEQIPQAVLGTVWIGTTNPNYPVQDVISFSQNTKVQSTVTSLADLIDLNIGRKVIMTYCLGSSSEPKTIEGIIMGVESSTADEKTGKVTGTGQIALIKTPRGSITAINKATIQTLTMAEDCELKTERDSSVVRTKIRVKGEPKTADITMVYVEKGIVWSPSYLVNIKDEKTADITLEAVLANDVEDLDDVDVSFVVGYPNFLFSKAITPMYLQQPVSQFVQSIMSDGGNYYGHAAGGLATQALMSNYAYGGSSGWSADNTYSAIQPMQGESNEDLYLYKQRHVTLKKGDRARYTVFSASVPYQHIYELTLPDSLNIDYSGHRNSSYGSNQSTQTQVWHSLRMDNTSKQPWTTAPAFVVNDGMPVAQDMMKYTSASGKRTLKLTVASDVNVDPTQKELSRKQVTVRNYTYDEITVSGQIKIKNFKQKAIRMNVLKSITGEVVEAGQGGKAVKVVKQISAVNPSSEVEWEYDLKPGEEKILTYSYTVLTSR